VKTERSRKKACPKCSNKDSVVEIVYGFPGSDLIEMAQRGEILLGGCCIFEDAPEYYCKKCDLKFR
jgi:hypothetical protein